MSGEIRRRRSFRGVGLVVLGIFIAVGLFTWLLQRNDNVVQNADAASLANFDAGYIISDYQMTNYNSMSEAEIQAWLSAKNPCNNTDYGYYQRLSAGSSHSWHFENGHFICLSEERFGDRDGEIGFQYRETAAHIIWQAAQDYRINPKALIVLLQKETGLVTDKIPNDWDYRRATGYGCPDTAACSEKYYGFKNQVRNAAYLFRIVMDGNSSYYPIGNNYIQYNPNAACGGSVVNIRNLATSALYRYTPYQPNAGALAAGYGTASCGAYGNRNFYLYWQDWFGGIVDEYNVGNEIGRSFADRYEKRKNNLGVPTSEIKCDDDEVCMQLFENGAMYYSASTGAWETFGDMSKRYSKIGTVKSNLGLPTGAIICSNERADACSQPFENGAMYYSASTGAWETFGKMWTYYAQEGAIKSMWGLPVGVLIIDGDMYVQVFERGKITL